MLIVKFRGLIDKIIQVLSTIIMGVMVIAVCWQVITRYILNNPSTVTAASEKPARMIFSARM